MKSDERGTNCEQEKSERLISIEKLSSILSEKPKEGMLSDTNFQEALNMTLTETEDSAISYICGYFLKQHMASHKDKNCEQCKSHIQRVNSKTEMLEYPDMFYFYKLWRRCGRAT